MSKEKEANEIEALKRSWERDPTWDIEDTEGFEAYRDELLAFSQERKSYWQKQLIKHQNELASKICPILSIGIEGFGYCKVEQCAWWNEANECCVVRALTLR